MSKKNIIVGMCTLSEFRDKKGVFIDKTEFISELENNAGTSVPIFLRPRRFGKTLTANMLHSYYDISEKENFEKNFKGTWIYNNKTPLASSYYVLHFDFSYVNSDPKGVGRSFLITVRDGIASFSAKYPELGLPKDQLDISLYENASEIMSAFLSNFSMNVEKDRYLYVIIDEYDYFAYEILTRDKEAFKNITSTYEGHEGLIKQFYAQLKAHYRGNGRGSIDRFFITGVTSITLNSVTSGFNIAKDISSNLFFKYMAGFTPAELSELIDETVDFAELDGISKEQITQIMEDAYDGYVFNEKADVKLFNSNLCLTYISDLITEGELPDVNNISLNDDIGIINGMLSLADIDTREEIILKMFNKEPIVSNITAKLNLNSSNQFNRPQIVSLLYHLGYLTIDPEATKKKRITTFVIPNKVYENLFFDYFRSYIGYRADDYEDLSSMYEESADLSEFLKIITYQIENKLNPQSLGRFSEMALQLIIDRIINNSLGRYLKSYLEFYTGNGYADVLVVNNYPGGHDFLLELKYLRKKDDTKSNVEKKIAEAEAEIKKYKRGSVLKKKIGKRKLDCYAMVFAGSECRKCVEIQG